MKYKVKYYTKLFFSFFYYYFILFPCFPTALCPKENKIIHKQYQNILLEKDRMVDTKENRLVLTNFRLFIRYYCIGELSIYVLYKKEKKKEKGKRKKRLGPRSLP